MTPELFLAALAGTIAGAVLTAFAVTRLVRLARQPELARAALAPTGPVELAEAGRAELALEGPLFTTQFRGLSFELVDPSGRPVTLHRLWMGTSSGGFSRTRLSTHRLDVAQPGTHELRVAGLDPNVDYARSAVVFVRPIGPGLAVTVVGLLASVGLAAASLAVLVALVANGSAPGGVPAAPASGTATRPLRRASIPDAHGGRTVEVDPARLAGAQEVAWPLLQMRVRVPADWVVRKVSDTEIDLRDPARPSTFVVGHATPMPSGPSFDEYLAAHVAHARERLEQRLIDGYGTKRLGTVPGIVTLEQRENGGMTLITWTGFEPAQGGSLSITLLAGAASVDFPRDEALLGAIVDSVRFE